MVSSLALGKQYNCWHLVSLKAWLTLHTLSLRCPPPMTPTYWWHIAMWDPLRLRRSRFKQSNGIAGRPNVLNMFKKFWEIASYPRKTQSREINQVVWDCGSQGSRFQTNATILCDYPSFHIVSDLIRRTTKIV